MALKKRQAVKPATSRRRPGESAVEWTVRNAYLWQKPTGRWVIKYTDVITDAEGETSYRTSEQACFTTDKATAGDRLSQWAKDKLTPKQTATTAMTFQELGGGYTLATRTQRLTRSQDIAVGLVMKVLGHHPADKITEQRLADLHKHILDAGLSEGTARRRLSVALAVLNWGARNKIISRDAVPFYKKPGTTPPRNYTLDDDEDARVFALAVKWLARGDETARRVGLFVCIALDCGQRLQAILGLTWDRINLTPGQEFMDFTDPDYRPKNKKRCADVFVTERLLAVLKQEARPTGAVFPVRRLRAGLAAFIKEANLPRLTPHVFRHTFATLRIKRGWTIADVAHILADDPVTVGRVYLHNAGISVRENARRIDAMRQAYNDNNRRAA